MLHLRSNTNVVPPKSRDYFHFSYVLAHSHNPILPLRSYNYMGVFWVSSEVVCLKGRYRLPTEHRARGTTSAKFTWHLSETKQRGREHVNFLTVVQLCIFGHWGARAETGDIWLHAGMYMFWNVYWKHLQEALGRIELNQLLLFLRQHSSYRPVLCSWLKDWWVTHACKYLLD